MTHLTVICARPDGQDEATGPPVSPVLAAVAAFTPDVHFVGRFPGKDIDRLLTGRIVVIGEENQLAAVVLRMVRRGLLGAPDTGPPPEITPVGYIPLRRNAFATRWRLDVGVAGVERACTGAVHPIPIARDDNGGVLISQGEIGDPAGTAYLDEHTVLSGPAGRLVVRPDVPAGLTVTVERKRALRLPPKRQTHTGRAFSVGFDTPTTVVSDGVARPRALPRWTWYAHTEPLYLARPAD
ncbi:MAG: hypothetical protein ABJA16_10110 [Nakamurella sp.]